MTAHELMMWSAYERTFGSLLIHERLDAGFAQVSMMLSDGKHKLRDFMPRWYQDLTADEELARGMEMMRGLGGVTDADD